MAIDFDPIVGNWYEHVDKGQKFEVIAIDEDSGTVEIQFYDGDIEEVDYDAWYELDVEPSEPPEDWTGPVDDVEEDDLGYTETEMSGRDWEESYDETPRRGRKSRVEDEDKDKEEEEEEDLDYGDEEWEE